MDVEAQGEVLGQVGRQTLHVAALHQLIDRLLLRDDQTRATALQGIQDVRQDVQHLLARLEGVVRVDIVDVVDCLLEMIGSILNLLQLPREVLSNARTLYHILLTLHFEAYVLKARRDCKSKQTERLEAFDRTRVACGLTEWVIESPVNVTTTFNCSGADVRTNLSTFLPSFP